MALISCHECGGMVSTEAATCPHCGAPPRVTARPVPAAPVELPPAPGLVTQRRAQASVPESASPKGRLGLAVGVGVAGVLVVGIAMAASKKTEIQGSAAAPAAVIQAFTRYASGPVPVYANANFTGDPIRSVLPGDTVRLTGTSGRVALLSASGDTVGWALAPLFQDSLTAEDLEAIQAARVRANAEEERRARLGFKILSPQSTAQFSDGTVRFRSVTQAGKWIMDRRFGGYSNEWQYRDAKRGYKFVLADVTINSQAHDPDLPSISVYRLEGTRLRRLGVMTYEFYKWRDFGAYLGNYADYGNDFAHTPAIRFSPGVELTEAELTGAPVFVLVSNTGCASRLYDQFSTPEIQYSVATCSPPYTLSLEQTERDFQTVRIFNRDLLQ